VCFDERPCFLIGDIIEGLEMEPGKVAKENYAYSKHGSCCVLAAIEPLTGKRWAHVRTNRKKREFALFMKDMIEIEFSALSRQCLNRRIPCMKKLESEVLTFFKERSQKGIKINWQFTQEQARQKLNRRYSEVNQLNLK